MAKRAIKAVTATLPVKLDLGCGVRKQPGFTGVDVLKLEGVDLVHDLTKPWPWKDESVDEVNCSHFLEHLHPKERIHFANELYRVLRKGAKATIVTPYMGHDAAYGDPTHVWPPISGWTYLYWNKEWRKKEAPHSDSEHVPGMLACDFDYTIGGSWDAWLQTRNMEYRIFAMQHYLNGQRDVIATLTRR